MPKHRLSSFVVSVAGTLLGSSAVAAQDGSGLASFVERVPGTAVEFEMAGVPAGEVTLPDGTRVEVEPFWIATTEVTWDLYDVYLYGLDIPPGEEEADAFTRPSKPYIPPDRGFGHAGYPAMGMTIQAARHFCEWLSAKTGRRYRLPTRAEWTHAALAGSPGPYAFGDAVSKLGDYAWFDANTNHKTEPVSKKKPNGWGLHDVHGNVAEWVETGARRPIAMGGSYAQKAGEASTLRELPYSRDWQMSDPQIPKSQWWMSDCGFVGMRLVCEPEPDAGHGDASEDDG